MSTIEITQNAIIEITQSESVKKSLEKSRNVLEEKRRKVKPEICIKKTNTFTIIVVIFVQEQLIIREAHNQKN